MLAKKKLGRPVERPETYRFSLYLDGDLKDFIKERSWSRQQSVTQYLNDLVRADMKSAKEARERTLQVAKKAMDAIVELKVSMKQKEM